MVLRTPNHSMDDLVLPSRHYQVERRARSTSPVKSRSHMSLDHVYTSAMRSGDSLLDLHSISSATTSHLTSEQLKQLSKSPISKRLHVSTNEKYVIPIPFTLQLPPKLSPKNLSKGARSTPVLSEPSSPSPTPLKEAKRPRLVYNGRQYEMLDETDTEDDLRKRLPGSPGSNRSPLPRRPSKQAISKSKSNLQIRDNLSIIEEVSVSGSSRHSSVRDRPPPVPPKDTPKEIPVGIAKLKQLVQPQPIKVAPISKHESMLARERTTPLVLPFHTFDPLSRKASDSPPTLSFAPEIPNSNVKYSEYTEFLPLDQRDRKISESSNASSISALNNNVGDMQEEYLRYKAILESREKAKQMEESEQQRQARADYELYVRNKLALPAYLKRGERQDLRSASSQSTSTTASSGMSSASEALSASSWNSLQRSIEISIAELSQKDINVSSPSRHASGSSQFSSDYGSWEDETSTNKESPTSSIEHGNETLVVAMENPEEVEFSQDSTPTVNNLGPIEPLVIRKLMKSVGALSSPDTAISNANDDDKDTSSVERSLTSDNEGAGKGFYFPNNLTNSTNDEQVRQRPDGFEAKHKLRRSFMSTTGQIEIPEFEESNDYSPSIKEKEVTQFNDELGSEEGDSHIELEPIGVPTVAARREFSKYLEAISDSDDTEYDNMKANPISKSESVPILSKVSSSTSPSVQRRKSMSPVRHQRNRSVFSISLDLNEMDINDDPTEKNTLANQRLAPPYTPKEHTKSDAVDTSDINDMMEMKQITAIPSKQHTTNQLPIVVAEPPKKVNYDIDFKELNVIEKDEFQAHTIPTAPSIMEIYANFAVEQPPKPQPIVAKEQQPTRLNVAHLSKNGDTSISSYQSSRSYKGTASSYTTQDDVESVVIDLTKEKYDVTHIQRQDSVMSYRSVTEKTKEGKLVEVVLLDDDDSGPTTNKDELESLYSKYRHFAFGNGSGSQYGGSTRSTASGDFETSSFASFTNSVSSAQQLRVKRGPIGVETSTQPPRINLKNIGAPMGGTSTDTKTITKMASTASSTPSTASSRKSVVYKSSRITLPQNRLLVNGTPSPMASPMASPTKTPEHQNSRNSATRNTISLNTTPTKRHSYISESKYFDYTLSGNYDFKSFMKERTST